jgi:hypothetical protein
MGYEIITLDQKDQWMSCLDSAENYDFYHTWQYNLIEKDGDPFLFLFKNDDDFIAFPLIKRRINNSDLFDLTSSYGYVGPISNRKFSYADSEFLNCLKISFKKFMSDERIVSVFSRLHPIITQQLIISELGGIFPNGETVEIDLDIPIEEQRKNYRKDHSNAIHTLHEKGFYVKSAIDADSVKTFITIYHENMRRVKATKDYFFDEDYFNNLLQAREFSTHILLVYLKEKPVAGGVFTFTNDIIQVHLLSTLTKYLYYSPVKMLVDEISVIGRKLNMKHLHLGGGVGGKNDSLFAWKSGFSDLHLNFETWRYINDQEKYDELVKENVPEEFIDQTDFFPLYRKTFANTHLPL